MTSGTAEPPQRPRTYDARHGELADACGTVPQLRPAKGLCRLAANPGFPITLRWSIDAPHGPDVNRVQAM